MQAALLAATRVEPAEIVVDLAAVGFIDACGISALLRARAAARRAGVGFSVHSPQPIAALVIDALGLAGALRVTAEPAPVSPCRGGPDPIP